VLDDESQNQPVGDVIDIVDSQAVDGTKADYCEHPTDTMQPTPPILHQV